MKYPEWEMERDRRKLMEMMVGKLKQPQKRAVQAFKKLTPDMQERVLRLAAEMRHRMMARGSKGFGFMSSIELLCALTEYQVVMDKIHDTWCPCAVCMGLRRNGNE